VEVRFLGEFEAVQGGVPVPVRGVKQRTVLALLALHRGGADLAGQAIKAGLADEVRLFLVPVAVGGGKRALPDGVRSDLELLDTQRFASGAVYLRYCLQSA
jgi:riboflavin biosynthesis pyrimidine reductase